MRKLPGEIAEAPVLYLRTSADAMALRQRFVAGTHVVVIGGGFIGLEVAAAASKRNCNVTVLEAQATLLSRTASTMLSEWIYRLHVAQRINVHLNTTVKRISQNASGKAALDTSAGLMTADFVVAGIGVVPNDELARGCGLQVENGIVVDSQCATVDPNVLAAGEVTSYHVAHLGTRVRSESWMAASEQGSVAGRVAAGDASADYAEKPWLWSDQFNSNIQCLGLPQMASKHTCIGDPDSNEWALLGWNADDRLVSAIAANRGRDVSAIRRAIRRGVPLPSQYTAAHPIASL